MCNATPSTQVCVCKHRDFHHGRWHSFVNLALHFLVSSSVFVLSGRDWWVKRLLGWWVTAQLMWEACGGGGQSVHASVLWCKSRKHRSWGRSALVSILSAFPFATSEPSCLENRFFFLVRPERDFTLWLKTFQPLILESTQLLYWLIECRAEDITASNHLSICISHDSI